MNKQSLTLIVAIKSYHIRTCPEDFRKQKYYFDSQYFMLTIICLNFYIDSSFTIDLKVNKKYASYSYCNLKIETLMTFNLEFQLKSNDSC